MPRHFWVLLHRYAGVAMAGFVIVVGVTGSLLAFLPELNHALTPHLFPPGRPTQSMGLGELALKAQMLLPQAEVHSVFVDESGSAYPEFELLEDPATGQPRELGFNALVLDAATGKELGRLTVGGLPTGRDDLMDFIYRLHMNLALPTIGGWVLGIVALIWTLDCFVGFYLTLPARRWQAAASSDRPQTGETRKTWWQRWQPAWMIKRRGSAFRINFDLHRAGGLWLWLALFVFAWSSVGFNLHEQVYRPVMSLLFDMPAEETSPATPPTGTRQPMGWLAAQATADRLMREQGRLHGFRVIWPNALHHEADLQRYWYRVRSSADVHERRGRTWLAFDDQSGRLLHVSLPTGQHSGTTVTSWLYALHMAHVFGMPYRIFVCALGLAITMLSVTGIVIWLRKRRARKLRVISIPTVRTG